MTLAFYRKCVQKFNVKWTFKDKYSCSEDFVNICFHIYILVSYGSRDPTTRVLGIRTHTGAGDTVWEPILNLYNIRRYFSTWYTKIPPCGNAQTKDQLPSLCAWSLKEAQFYDLMPIITMYDAWMVVSKEILGGIRTQGSDIFLRKYIYTAIAPHWAIRISAWNEDYSIQSINTTSNPLVKWITHRGRMTICFGESGHRLSNSSLSSVRHQALSGTVNVMLPIRPR